MNITKVLPYSAKYSLITRIHANTREYTLITEYTTSQRQDSKESTTRVIVSDVADSTLPE